MDLSKLITSKDIILQTYIESILDQLHFEPSISPAELELFWINKIEKIILSHDQGTVLLRKLQPLIPIIVKQRINDNPLKIVTIEPPLEDTKNLVNCYKKCFDSFLDSPFTSFKTNNLQALGNISLKDYFILQFLSSATCKRIRGDGNLQCGLSGASSIGKSIIFEGPILGNAHVYTSEKGVGRFVTGQKTLFLLNDVCVKNLFSSKDSDVFKLICRGEVATAKTFGSVSPIEPIFVFYTSNTRLFTHTFPPAKEGQFGQQFQSHLQTITSKSKEELAAFQNRFIELFAYSPPPNLDVSVFYPKSGTFQLIHLVLGTFERVLSILKKYTEKDFFSPILPMYCFSFLFQYYRLFQTVYECNDDLLNEIVNIAKQCLTNDYLDLLLRKYNLSF